MSTHDEQMQAALEHHQAGRLAQADQLYRQVLAAEPRHAGARHLLGLVALQAGRPDVAVQLITDAIRLEGGHAAYHANLGEAFRALGRLADAQASYEQALRLAPQLAEAHNNLGTLYQSQGNIDAAISAYHKALSARPDYADAHNNLGTVYQQQRDWAAAADCYRRAVLVAPNYAKAHYNLGVVLSALGQGDAAGAAWQQTLTIEPGHADALYNLGVIEQQAGNWAAALDLYERAVRSRPDHVLAHNNLGNVYRQLDRYDEAIACYRRALAASASDTAARNNLGATLQHQGRIDEAVSLYQQTVATDPTCAQAYNNLGIALQELGERDQALEQYERCLKLDPTSAEAHYNRGLLLLSQQRFADGWPEFAWRLQCPSYPRRAFEQPLWSGEPLAGGHLWVHAEQGLGDTFHFARYVLLLTRAGLPVTFEVQRPLVPLLSAAGFQVVPIGTEPRADWHVPLLDLPTVFQTTLDNLPVEVPYLRADDELVADWGRRLGERTGLRVGVAWQGSRRYQFDHTRSIPLAEFAPLAAVPGVRLVSLQQGEGSEQLLALAGRFAVESLPADVDTTRGAFMDTAAVMKNLDLVITSDTSIAHLAGALGVPVWVALSTVPEWRWFVDREDSPWYPTMRLYRQSVRGQWPEVFARMAGALALLAGG